MLVLLRVMRASMLKGQAADLEDATPSVERCPACDGRRADMKVAFYSPVDPEQQRSKLVRSLTPNVNLS